MIVVKTNNQARPLFSVLELTSEQRKQLEKDCSMEGIVEDSAVFKYNGAWYRLDEFVVTWYEMAKLGWHGVQHLTVDSGTLIKINDKDQTVICGRFYSKS